MINDNQPAFNFGLLSGRYNLSRARANSYFTGWVLETTAAVNWGMEGGPLLDSRGRMIGMITLNYSPHRWLGNAIPMENLAPRIEALLKEKAEAAAPRAEEGPQRAGSIGMTVRPEAGGFVADRVDEDGPAWDVGIRPGDPVLGIGANDLTGVEQFERFVSELKAGDIAWLRISLLGREREVRIEVGPSSKKEERK
jgi:S1-C subfamily serine protease